MDNAVRFDRADLNRAVSTALKVAPWSRPYQAMVRSGDVDREVTRHRPGALRIEVGDGRATITSANFDLSIIVTMAAEGRGLFIVPADQFAAMVGKAAGDIEMVADDHAQGVRVKSGKLRVLLTADPSDVPTLRARELGAPAQIGAEVLAEGLHSAERARARNDTQPWLAGVHLDGERGLIVAMDGARIHARSSRHAAIGLRAILPPGLVKLLDGLLPDDGDVAIRSGEGAIELSFGNVRVTSGLLRGTYPDHAQHFQAGTTHTLTARADLLARDLDFVCACADPKTRDFRLDLGGAAPEASAFRNTGEAARVMLDAGYSGAPLAIGFAYTAVADALEPFGSAQVQWRMAGPRESTFITSEDRPGLEMMVSPFILAADHQRIAA